MIFLVRSHILELLGLSFAFSQGNYFLKSFPWTNTFKKLHENPHGNEKEIGCMFSLWKWILAPSRGVVASLTLSNKRRVIKKEYFHVQQLIGSITSQNPAVVVRVCFRGLKSKGKTVHIHSNSVQGYLSLAQVSPAWNPALSKLFSSLPPEIDANRCCGCCFTSGTWASVFAGQYTVLTLFIDLFEVFQLICTNWCLQAVWLLTGFA